MVQILGAKSAPATSENTTTNLLSRARITTGSLEEITDQPQLYKNAGAGEISATWSRGQQRGSLVFEAGTFHNSTEFKSEGWSLDLYGMATEALEKMDAYFVHARVLGVKERDSTGRLSGDFYIRSK
jgi:hypothetical protein